MALKYKALYYFKATSFILICIFGIISLYGGCGGGSSGSGDAASDSGADSIKEIIVDGTISDVVAKSTSNQRPSFYSKIANYIQFTKSAVAQEENGQITVEAFDGMNMFITGTVVDENGNFSLEIPCDTDIFLLFSSGDSTVETGVINFSCPENEGDNTFFITVSLNFEDEEIDTDIEEQEGLGNAVISCIGDEEIINVGEEDFEIDGEGGACIITAGECGLKIIAGTISLNNCSNCIDTRGISSFTAITTKFNCAAVNDGIRAVGSSTAKVLTAEFSEILELAPIAIYGTETSSKFEEDDPDINISSGGDGVNSNGNSLVVLSTNTDVEFIAGDSDDGEGEDCVAHQGEGNCGVGQGLGGGNGTGNEGNGNGKSFDPNGSININGAEHGVLAVSNSMVIIDGEDCSLLPFPGTEIKGNAEIQVVCGL